VDHQPARALRQGAAHDEDRDRQQGAEPERKAPAQVGGEDRGVEQDSREAGAERRTEPEAAVDREIDPAALLGGDELVDRRVDRGVLAADARTGEEAEEHERPEAECEGGRDRGDQVEAEGDDEELASPQAIRQIAEADRPAAGAEHIRGARLPELGGGEPECSSLLEAGADRPDDRHLDAVEDPDGSEAGDHEPVPAAERQPVHAGRDLGLHGAGSALHPLLEIPPLA
jgi:hypothetical protein